MLVWNIRGLPEFFPQEVQIRKNYAIYWEKSKTEELNFTEISKLLKVETSVENFNIIRKFVSQNFKKKIMC